MRQWMWAFGLGSLLVATLALTFTDNPATLGEGNPGIRRQSGDTGLPNTLAPAAKSMSPRPAVPDADQPSKQPRIKWLEELKPPAGRLVDSLAVLQSRIADGDTDAMTVLATSLRRCVDAPSSHSELNDRTRQTVVDRSGRESEPRQMNALEAQALSDQFAFCEGIPKDLVSSWHALLGDAARAGNLHAQLRFASEPHPLMLEASRAKMASLMTGNEYTPPTALAQVAEEYRRERILLLEAARDAGSIEAFRALSQLHSTRTGSQVDSIEALALLMAIEEIYDQAGVHDRSLDGALQIAKFKARPTEVEQAIERASRLLSGRSCCVLKRRS